jgi:hypothetical protein
MSVESRPLRLGDDGPAVSGTQATDQPKGIGKADGARELLPPDWLYRHDPFLVFLRCRLHLGDGWLVVGTGLLTAAILLGGPALVGASLGGPGDLVALLYALILFPSGFAIYLLLPGAVAGLFWTLGATGVIAERRDSPSEQSYEDFLGQLAAWFDVRWLAVGSLLLVVGYWVYRPIGWVPGDIQGHVALVARWSYPWLRAGLIIAYSPTLYGVVLSVARLTIALIFTARLFGSFHIRINPLHPDGAGGLGVFGRLLTASILIAAAPATAVLAIGLVFALAHLNPFTYAELWSFGAFTLVFIPLIAVTWLWMPHRAMVDARDRMLQPLADEFLRAIPLPSPAETSDPATIKADTDRLVEYKRRYELLRDTSPTWPVTIQAVPGLGVTSLLSLLPGLTTIVRPILETEMHHLFPALIPLSPP